jgi:hypothetical protein
MKTFFKQRHAPRLQDASEKNDKKRTKKEKTLSVVPTLMGSRDLPAGGPSWVATTEDVARGVPRRAARSLLQLLDLAAEENQVRKRVKIVMCALSPWGKGP